jgi:hypothetical protein
MKHLLPVLLLLTLTFACQSNQTSIDGCYTNVTPATADAPTSSTETIELTVTGDKVSGNITGMQDGPEIQNAYSGVLEGTKTGDVLSVETTFTIEGSTVIEKQEYQVKDNELLKKEGPLHEVDGKLELEPGATFNKPYKKGACQ